MSRSGDWLLLHRLHDGDECLLWPFGKDRNGYGRATLSGGSSRLAHRLMCEIAHGPPQSQSMVAMHMCRGAASGCVNPKHIRWGTQLENVRQRATDGTEARGAKTGVAVLSPPMVCAIRKLKGTHSQRNIARAFGLKPSTVQSVIDGRSWGWVDEGKLGKQEHSLLTEIIEGFAERHGVDLKEPVSGEA